MKNFDFIIALHALAKVAGCLRPLSTAIQQVGLDVLKAVSDVLDVIGLLQKYRNDSECFIALFQSAVGTAKLLEITVKKPRTVGRSVYRDNSGGNGQSVEEYYRLNLFLPLIDSVCSHLQDRFGPVQQKLFGLSALVPAHLGSYNDVVAGASLYEALISVHELPTEFELWTEHGLELMKLDLMRFIDHLFVTYLYTLLVFVFVLLYILSHQSESDHTFRKHFIHWQHVIRCR